MSRGDLQPGARPGGAVLSAPAGPDSAAPKPSKAPELGCAPGGSLGPGVWVQAALAERLPRLGPFPGFSSHCAAVHRRFRGQVLLTWR